MCVDTEVHVCTCVYMSVYTYEYVYVPIWRPEIKVNGLPRHFHLIV